MHEINWIHLSDIHIRPSTADIAKYNSDIVLKALWNDIDRSRTFKDKFGQLDFAVITGDIAWAGGDSDSDEYDEVYIRLLQELSIHSGLALSNIFLVPGNHDVARSLRDDNVKSIEEELQDKDKLIELLVARERSSDRDKIFNKLSNYRKFIETYLPHIKLDENLCFESFLTTTSGKNIRIIGLNSAWGAQGGKADLGKIVIGEPIVYKYCEPRDNVDLTLCLVHHPLGDEWYSGHEKNSIIKMSAACDFILSGHVHAPNVLSSYKTSGPCIEIVAGSIYEDRNWKTNSYNYVSFDLIKKSGHVFLRKYNDGGPQGPEWIRDLESTGDDQNGIVPIGILQIPDALKKKDDLLGGIITNQLKELNRRPLLSSVYHDRDEMKVLFPDVYVDPIIIPKKNPTSPIHLSEWMGRQYQKTNRILILGGAGSGKTTSLISIYHSFAANYVDDNERMPIFSEARSYDWNSPLQPKVIIKAINRDIDPPDNTFVFLIDAVDEAFPSVYLDNTELNQQLLLLDFPHIATCRSDFYDKNLRDTIFSENYDEILEIQPWNVETEAILFLQNYYDKRFGNYTDHKDDITSIIDCINSSRTDISEPLTPLTVTVYLFLWLYDNEETRNTATTSYALLLRRFAYIWAKRELRRDSTYFKTADDLLKIYEAIALSVFFRRNDSKIIFENVLEEVAQKLGLPFSRISTFEGISSFVRTKPIIDSNNRQYISFLHEALYELLLAQSIHDSLITCNKIDALNHHIGRIINRYTRQLIDSNDYNNKVVITNNLEKMYFASLKDQSKITTRIKHIVNYLTRNSHQNKLNINEGIIYRHNLCYFWGRTEPTIGKYRMKWLYEKLVQTSFSDHIMIEGTIGSGILYYNDLGLQKTHISRLEEGGKLDVYNRIYHKIYYGDQSYYDPDTFLEDTVTGPDDWARTRKELITRMGSSNSRYHELRVLDLLTFRRFCETRGVPKLTIAEKSIIKRSNQKLSVSAKKKQLIDEQYNRLIAILGM